MAWCYVKHTPDGPSVIILTRQNLELLDSVNEQLKGDILFLRFQPSGLLIATGSEVGVALKAQEELKKENIFVDVFYDLQRSFENQSENIEKV